MAYLTLKQLIDRYGADEIVQITNDRTSSVVQPSDLKNYAEGNDASPSADVLIIAGVVNERIKDAEAYAMSFVHSVYDVTSFTEENAPRDLRAITAAIARYFLHENRMNTRVHQGFQDAQLWLQNKPNVGINDQGVKTKQAGVKVLTGKITGSRVFSDESEKRFTEGY